MSSTDIKQEAVPGSPKSQVPAPHSGPSKKRQQRLELVLLGLAPLLLGLYLFATHPFKETLASRSIDLSKFTSSQRLNFLTAARALDGAIIKPQGVFSFNGRVGPRQVEKGFVPAPGYLDGQKQNTNGGGICLISSTLYQVALLCDLQIVQRTAHTSTVGSVAPGLDATVWYGQADLKFKNTYGAPVAINCHQEGEQLFVSIDGDIFTKLTLQAKKPTLRRREITGSNQNLLVEVYLKDGSGEHLVSRDRYQIHR